MFSVGFLSGGAGLGGFVDVFSAPDADKRVHVFHERKLIVSRLTFPKGFIAELEQESIGIRILDFDKRISLALASTFHESAE